MGVRSLRKLDQVALGGAPVLSDHFERIGSRPAVRAALEAAEGVPA